MKSSVRVGPEATPWLIFRTVGRRVEHWNGRLLGGLIRRLA
jgi:hypothetical protein